MSAQYPQQHQPQRWVSFINESGETIPSYACMMLISDTETDPSTLNYKQRLLFQQPDSTVSDANKTFALNSRVPVPPGSYGSCTFAIDAPAWARIVTDSGNSDWDVTDPTKDWVGQEWGPQDGQWDIDVDGKGYIIQSAPDLGQNRVLVRRRECCSEQAWFVVDYNSLYFPGGVYDFGSGYGIYGNRSIDSDGGGGGIGYLFGATRVKSWKTVDSDGNFVLLPHEYESEGTQFDARLYPFLIVSGDAILGEPVSPAFSDYDPPFGSVPKVWRPVMGGTNVFPFAKTKEDIYDKGLVDIYVPFDPQDDSSELPLPWDSTSGWKITGGRAVIPITQEPVMAGTWVSLTWYFSARKLVITGLGCPPYTGGS